MHSLGRESENVASCRRWLTHNSRLDLNTIDIVVIVIQVVVFCMFIPYDFDIEYA